MDVLSRQTLKPVCERSFVATTSPPSPLCLFALTILRRPFPSHRGFQTQITAVVLHVISACCASKHTLPLDPQGLNENADSERTEKIIKANVDVIVDGQHKSLQTCRRDAQPVAGQKMDSTPAKILVGYALTSKKAKSFLKPKLEVLAREKGIVFVPIEKSRPLREQGPFDVILHKITGKEWWSQLEEYRRRYPDVVVLDPPDAIQHVRNRQSMLQEVAKLKLRGCGGQVDVPKQLVVTGDPSTIPGVVAKAGLKLPLVAKPLVVDGTAQSHALSLAFDELCLTSLNPPLVLQEFVNHGGVLFKVYIVGDSIRVVRRFSLPDVHKQVGNGVITFPRVSSAAASADDADLDPEVAELPPCELLDCLSKELRCRLGLRLFNLDIIREGGAGNHYYVIDINYFPGFGKVPGYEYVFTDFLLSLAQSSTERSGASLPCSPENSSQDSSKDK
ncbi:hypothetical protein GOP47_0018629 [Adiantum capillus-veneris]|uniref:Inositol-tetrakisphosphate 1-kinase n=1 Tax=Adiantum capillus-veneris TaxID=13818 RepID=A0A9D4UDS4_ADICA|nr:hypothetical protein GOP47_0018629 [Adiantum capillus-veneris]